LLADFLDNVNGSLAKFPLLPFLGIVDIFMEVLCCYVLLSVFFPAQEKIGLVQLVPEHIVEHAEIEPALD
jgi:hypothetical protein